MLRREMLLSTLLLMVATPVLAEVRMSDWALALPSAAAAPGEFAELEAPAMGSRLAMAMPQPEMAQDLGGSGSSDASGITFSMERAQVILRSLTLPGWGQATLGHEKAAWIFGLAEAGIWGSFAAFKIQEGLRRDAYERTAAIRAGISLDGRDEEFRRIIGSYLSSEEYNRLVVFRDAANLYYDDPVAYRQYIAENELKGGDTWQWASVNDLFRYRSQRQNEQRASNRANTALAFAIANRILSSIHAARVAGQPTPANSWQFEYSPDVEDPTAFRVGVSRNF